ncbi:hypothetical protein VOLCADRAFT_100045 [Volvox carteri f. nagariensis]|uniref:DUF1995 domain-containing protein n=1 Tax=Volvox carteri f. nagariensis TaxID=3068 RepID=D8UJ99_VOLCA|nr:uncharacterized protein VOLCADRAFT_100045 [Volvox carteri f. nagariensis]EFJ40183.1 hypothetical protein VOLCADRAFT_100045 [Volvox carteri f. nagariensis]|eukprot:XP_002958727.1 hypothetical protein VOLCADRAFT_100045 [Volvox carteri f. nagariensis]
MNDRRVNRVVPIPDGPVQQAQQAAQAIETAWRDGVRLQRLELLLPLIGATDLDDWPGGIRQQFKAAQPMVESVLRTVKQIKGLQGPLAANIWDQGDAVGAWTGKNLACVLFPTAGTLDKLTQLCNGPDAPELVLIVNPQWETRGNLVSDFGFGQRKAEAERFINSFQPTYCLKQLRVYGDSIRTLKAHPNRWQVHVVDRGGSSDCIATRDEQPSYQEIEALLRDRPESMMNKSIFDRIKIEFAFNQDSLKQQP